MIQQFAEKYKLKVSRHECGDAIIRGKRGHLYVDNRVVCAMWTDAPPMKQSRLEPLGETFWQGDIGRNAKGRRVQDAWVRGIRPAAYGLAIRMVGAKARRVMSREVNAVLRNRRRLAAVTIQHSDPLLAALERARKTRPHGNQVPPSGTALA